MIYIVVEGIVFRLFEDIEATNEIAIDPFDGEKYTVQNYSGADTISNFSDWKIFDCKNAAIALLMAAAGSSHRGLRQKIMAQMDLREWFLSNNKNDASIPLNPKNWRNKKINDENFDPWNITPQQWFEIYPQAHAIKDTSDHKKLLDLYDQPFGFDWVSAHV
jgi:hypothetical protein